MSLVSLRKILPRSELVTDSARCKEFAGDKWFAAQTPDAVALPRSTASVAKLLAFAHAHRIPITPRGAGYGYVGGCVPNKGGIVLSLERMDRIKEISAADFGAVVRLGGRVHKNKTGFDLHRLFTGSEGLLGVVTEATLKLLPFPPSRACLAVGFRSTAVATRAIRGIFQAGFLPCALEVADSFTLDAARRRTGSRQLEGCHSLFIVELDGREPSVRADLRALERVIRASKPGPLFADRAIGHAACERLWQIRREFSYSLRDTGLTKLNQDIVVPRGRLEDLFQFTARLQKKHGLPVAAFGHAGDGNIHVNIMLDRQQPGAEARAQAALDDLFKQILAWGGSITGEHGIGLAKLRWWPQAADDNVRKLHRQVKRALDPRGILNPGKFV